MQTDETNSRHFIPELPPVPMERIIAAFAIHPDPVANTKWWSNRMIDLGRHKWLAHAQSSKGISGRGKAQAMWHPHLVAYGLIGIGKIGGTKLFTPAELTDIVASHFGEHLKAFKALLERREMLPYWKGLVRSARSGNVEDARGVLKDFAETVENADLLGVAWSGPLPWQIAQYLACAFRQILEGIDAGKALNLVGKTAGRQKGKAVTHNMDALAAAFWLLRRNGLAVEKTNKEMCQEIGVDRSTISRARTTENNETYEHIDDELLKNIATPYSSQVGAILDRCLINPRNSRSRKPPR